jgi:hypothetical protein
MSARWRRRREREAGEKRLKGPGQVFYVLTIEGEAIGQPVRAQSQPHLEIHKLPYNKDKWIS